MKKNTLKKPLINSVLILIALSTLLYLIAGNPEASLWSSLGLIIRGILRTVQWLIAMLLALIVCLAFLFAVFFGAVALFDRETAARMYSNLKTVLFSWIAPCTEQCCIGSPCTCTQGSSDEAETEEAAAESAEQYEAINAEINNIQGHLHTTRQILTDKIDQLNARIDNLDAMTADMAGKQQLDTLSHEVQDAMDSLSGVQSAVSVMQSAVDQTANQLKEISLENSSERILGDIPGRIRNLEEQQAAVKIPDPVDIAPLQDDIKAMQAELSQVKEKADKALQSATERPEPVDIAPLQNDIKSMQAELSQVKEKAGKALQSATERPDPVDIAPLQNDIKAMQAELSQVKEKAGKALQSATEIPDPVDIAPLQDDIKAMQAELSQVKEKAGKALQSAIERPVAPVVQEAPPESASTVEQSAPSPEQEQPKEEKEHRIFSYFNDATDKEKLVELVQSALDKNMSYKQALNYIVKEFGPNKGKIISSHPSLSKDYIRQCRKKG